MQSITLTGILPDTVTLERGEYYLLEARSGGGKTSLLAFLTGQRTDYSGTIAFDGTDIRTLSIDRWCLLRRTEIALMPQENTLFEQLSVRDNLRLKNDLTRQYTDDGLRGLLHDLHIADKADEPVWRLSTGQRQRVSLARALCQPFSFLLLDEPAGHLDDDACRAAAALVLREARERRAAILVTSVGRRLPLPYTRTLTL